jgi:hypothetical protein
MGFEHSSFEFWFCFEFRVSCFGFYDLFLMNFAKTRLCLKIIYSLNLICRITARYFQKPLR